MMPETCRGVLFCRIYIRIVYQVGTNKGIVWDQLLQHTLLKLPAHKILLYSMIYVVECELQLYLMDASAVVLLPFMAVLHAHTHTVGFASWAKHFL